MVGGHYLAAVPVLIKDTATAAELLDESIRSHLHNGNTNEVKKYNSFKLFYKNGVEVVNIPRTQETFRLNDYKSTSGFNYGEMKFYFSPVGKSTYYIIYFSTQHMCIF